MLGIEKPGVPPHLFQTVAEDIEWLRDTWLLADETPDTATIRRGSAVLRSLLVNNLIQIAWKQCGLPGGPTLTGPDLRQFADHANLDIKLAASVVSGGGIINGIQYSIVGAWRIDNPTTGIPASADERFAVLTSSVARDCREEPEPSELDPIVQKEWKLSAYFNAPSAVRRGDVISRKSLIEFFANYAGGVHLDRANSGSTKRALYEFVDELTVKVSVEQTDGLHFELLSIGQAIGASADMQKLAETIRANASAPS